MSEKVIEVSRGAWWAFGAAGVVVTLLGFYGGIDQAKRQAEDAFKTTEIENAELRKKVSELLRLSKGKDEDIRQLKRQLDASNPASSDQASNRERMLAEQNESLKAKLDERELRLRDMSLELSQLRVSTDTTSSHTVRSSGSASTESGTPLIGQSKVSDEIPRASPLNLATLIGRWVGIADCARGTYPTSIDVKRTSGSELGIIYSDSKNSQDTEGALILISAERSAKPQFAFRTRDDRFIVLKNGHKLVLSDSAHLKSPDDADKQCKTSLRKN